MGEKPSAKVGPAEPGRASRRCVWIDIPSLKALRLRREDAQILYTGRRLDGAELNRWSSHYY